jgi:hypothetical protein
MEMRMPLPVLRIGNAMTMVRLAAIVIAFVLGHDVMMTMLPQHAAAESAHHQVIKVEQCGSAEGMVHPHSGPPIDQSIANLVPDGLAQYLDTGASRTPEPVYVHSDASARRAWLQVFLN